MHDIVFYVALGWMTLLLVAVVVLLVRARGRLTRLLALDTLVLVLVALLVLFADSTRSSYYLDAALALALLSFVATLAGARYHADGRAL